MLSDCGLAQEWPSNPLTASVLPYLQMIVGEVRGAFSTPEIRIHPQVVSQLSWWFYCSIILFMNLIKEIFSPICSVWAIAFGVRTRGRDFKELSTLLEIEKENWIEIYCLPLLGVSAAKNGTLCHKGFTGAQHQSLFSERKSDVII